jgi:hypothetical protein
MKLMPNYSGFRMKLFKLVLITHKFTVVNVVTTHKTYLHDHSYGIQHLISEMVTEEIMKNHYEG